MKIRIKVLYLLLICFCLQESPAFTYSLYQWRWRNDDGDEATASWKADVGVPFNLSNLSAFRLRIKLANNPLGLSVYEYDYKLVYYAEGDEDNAKTITNNPDDGLFYLCESPYLVENTPTTLQLPVVENRNFIPGAVLTSSSLFNADINNMQEQEWEFVLKPKTSVSNGNYYFEIKTRGNNNLVDYSGITAPPAYLTSWLMPPVFMTSFIRNIGNTSAEFTGRISEMCSLNITKRGICINTAGLPTTDDAIAEETDNIQAGEFSYQLTDLAENTLYHVRAFASNELGTSYSEEITFTTIPTLGEWGLIAFGSLIAVIGVAVVWRRIA